MFGAEEITCEFYVSDLKSSMTLALSLMFYFLTRSILYAWIVLFKINIFKMSNVMDDEFRKVVSGQIMQGL